MCNVIIRSLDLYLCISDEYRYKPLPLRVLNESSAEITEASGRRSLQHAVIRPARLGGNLFSLYYSTRMPHSPPHTHTQPPSNVPKPDVGFVLSSRKHQSDGERHEPA